MKKILFVCHGNICRSPMAEFVMKDLAKKAGLVSQFHIESAATSREELGNPVYPPARRKLAEHGISCDGHAARQLTNQDYDTLFSDRANALQRGNAKRFRAGTADSGECERNQKMADNKIPVICVKDLYKIYRVGESKVRALNGVDFTIYKGEFCAIVGTSGSGKSTLLNMLAGLEKPTKGEIVIAGEHIENKTENQLVRFRREHIGFIFQSFNLLSTMTALENVALPLTFQGVDKAKRLKRASALLDLVKLGKYKNHRPTQMSGGQQQRVGVARALVVDPEIIFADEPTGNLDSNTSREVMELMQQVVHEKQQTLVMVTHDNHLASFADRIFHIIDGKIVRIDDMTGKSKEEREKEEKKREEEASI